MKDPLNKWITELILEQLYGVSIKDSCLVETIDVEYELVESTPLLEIEK